MKRTLMDIYGDNIDKANKYGLIRFVFVYETNYYLCLWQNAKWSEPIQIVML